MAYERFRNHVAAFILVAFLLALLGAFMAGALAAVPVGVNPYIGGAIGSGVLTLWATYVTARIFQLPVTGGDE